MEPAANGGHITMRAAMIRLALGTVTVAISILLWALAQGIGESIGHGMHEWLVR